MWYGRGPRRMEGSGIARRYVIGQRHMGEALHSSARRPDGV